MTVYEAILNLTPKHLERLLDQVFLTGVNTGFQSFVEPELSDENPFNEEWLNSEAEGALILVDEVGEDLIIDPLYSIIEHILHFDTETVPENICWKQQVILPKEFDKKEQENQV